MKKFSLFVLSTLLLSFLFVLFIVTSIVSFPKDTFEDTYQSVIRDKFNALIKTNEPKIILIAGSSSAFGLDQELLEKMTGYKVVNLGLHASFGIDFESEIAKANIRKGDIILLGYEYLWFEDSSYQKMASDLVLSGIDTEFSIYKYIPLRKIPQLIGYIFPFAYKKNTYIPNAKGVYSRLAFDSETGQMTWYRDRALSDYFDNIDYYGNITVEDDNGIVNIGTESIKYLTRLKNYVESKGAKIFFVSSPVMYDSINCEIDDFLQLKKLEEEMIDIPYISDPRLYMFPADLMYNSINHTNSEGEKFRTGILADDLKRIGIGITSIKSNTLKMEVGEPITLTDNLPKRLLHIPEKIHQVYRIENGEKIIYKEEEDFIFDSLYGTIMRSSNSSIPNYKNHKVNYQNGKFAISDNNPEKNVSYQILIDYEYYVDNQELKPIDNKSNYLSSKFKEKIINKEKIKIMLCGDFIGTGVDTNKKDIFLDYLSSTLAEYYGVMVETKILAFDNSTHNNLMGNIELVLSDKPDLVLIEYGFNDHLYTFPSKEENLTKFSNDLNEAVSTFLKNGIDIALIGFFQQNIMMMTENVDDTLLYNRILKDIAQKNNIFFADVFDTFYKVGLRKHMYQDVMADYIHHPNEWGHKLYITSIMDLFNINENIIPFDLENYIFIDDIL